VDAISDDNQVICATKVPEPRLKVWEQEPSLKCPLKSAVNHLLDLQKIRDEGDRPNSFTIRFGNESKKRSTLGFGEKTIGEQIIINTQQDCILDGIRTDNTVIKTIQARGGPFPRRVYSRYKLTHGEELIDPGKRTQ